MMLARSDNATSPERSRLCRNLSHAVEEAAIFALGALMLSCPRCTEEIIVERPDNIDSGDLLVECAACDFVAEIHWVRIPRPIVCR